MMKKELVIFVLSFMALTLLVGCQFSSTVATQTTTPATEPVETIDPNVLSKEPPPQDILQEIYELTRKMGTPVDVTEYPKYCPDGSWYCGTINGCIVTSAITGDACVESYLRVADSSFKDGMPFNLFVYKDGEVNVLSDAYEKGWLTKEHIEQLEVRYFEKWAEVNQAREEYYQSLQEIQGS